MSGAGWLHVVIPKIEAGPCQQFFFGIEVPLVKIHADEVAGGAVVFFELEVTAFVVFKHLLDVFDGADLGKLVGSHGQWLAEQNNNIMF